MLSYLIQEQGGLVARPFLQVAGLKPGNSQANRRLCLISPIVLQQVKGHEATGSELEEGSLAGGDDQLIWVLH